MVMFVCCAFDYSDCQQHEFFGSLSGLSLVALNAAKSAPATRCCWSLYPLPAPSSLAQVALRPHQPSSFSLLLLLHHILLSEFWRITLGDKNFRKFFLVLHSKDSRIEIEILRMLRQEHCVWLVILCLLLWMLATPFPLLFLSIRTTAFDYGQ